MGVCGFIGFEGRGVGVVGAKLESGFSIHCCWDLPSLLYYCRGEQTVKKASAGLQTAHPVDMLLNLQDLLYEGRCTHITSKNHETTNRSAGQVQIATLQKWSPYVVSFGSPAWVSDLDAGDVLGLLAIKGLSVRFKTVSGQHA